MLFRSTISGCSTKYAFILNPFSSVFRCTQSGSMSIMRSRFCRMRMSETTSVPALPLKVLFGSRIAPSRSALCASTFQDKTIFGWNISSDQFSAFFFFCWIASLLYLAYTIYNAFRHKDSVDDIINDLINNREC